MRASARVSLFLLFCAACAGPAAELPPVPESIPAQPAGDIRPPVFVPYDCPGGPPPADTLRYDAARLAFVQFADSITSTDKCWLVRRGLRIEVVFEETASANVTLPDSFTGDLRNENPRIVKFTVRMR